MTKMNKIICSKCLLTEGAPGISFNEDVICNNCLGYVPMTMTEGAEKLLAELDRFRNPDSKA